MKYVNTGIVFQEIPDEVSLSINISDCPCHCPDCHSTYLWRDIGTLLTPESLDKLITDYGTDITCVCFMGGDADPVYVNDMARYVHKHHPRLKVGWYSGRVRISSLVDRNDFDYIKIGPYIRHLGPLNAKTTNQRLYKRVGQDRFEDITHRFWKR